MILLLLAAALVAWWGWGRGLNRNQLIAIASALLGGLLLFKGRGLLALILFIPGFWLFVRPMLAARPPGAMDADEARRVLGLGRDADADGIRAAHRRLVARVHPDQGGSADLAGRVNAARDILLAEQAKRYPR